MEEKMIFLSMCSCKLPSSFLFKWQFCSNGSYLIEEPFPVMSSVLIRNCAVLGFPVKAKRESVHSLKWIIEYCRDLAHSLTERSQACRILQSGRRFEPQQSTHFLYNFTFRVSRSIAIIHIV